MTFLDENSRIRFEKKIFLKFDQMPILSEYQTRIFDRRARLEFITHLITHHFAKFSKIRNESFFRATNYFLMSHSNQMNHF